jgi:hypothetical protein
MYNELFFKNLFILINFLEYVNYLKIAKEII